MFYTNTLNAAPYTLIRSADANAQFALVASRASTRLKSRRVRHSRPPMESHP